MVTTPEPELFETRIHEILNNDRCWMVIKYLQDSDPTLRELSKHIIEAKTGESPPLRNIRQNAYVSLQQTHVLKLAELDITNHSEESKVALLAKTDDVTTYMGAVSESGLSQSEYYAALTALGIVLIIVVAVGIPVISAVGAPGLGPLIFAALDGSMVYQRWT